MIICGIDISGSEAKIVILEGEKKSYKYIEKNPRKIILRDDTNQNEVIAFKENIFAFIRENNIERIAIKQRNKKGNFSGGPVGFKLEGLIQLYKECEVILISANSIASTIKKEKPDYPEGIMKYQEDAFKTAYKALP